jgi:hypothetical protein
MPSSGRLAYDRQEKEWKAVMVRSIVWGVLSTTLALSAAACRPAALTQQVDAQRIAADLRVQLTKSTEAGNRAVMSDTDEEASTAAGEARAATTAADSSVTQLRSLLQSLGYEEERRLLDAFATQFNEYKTLDAEILPLSLENTNLKAERLSFGPARDAVETFRTAVIAAAATADPASRWRAKSVAEEGIAALLDILALHGPHIAEAQDATMAHLEERMASADASAAQALVELKQLTGTKAAAQLASATAALAQFRATTKEVVTLSRRNSDVRSLALSLGRKRMVAATCDDDLQALEEALARHAITATR